MSVIQHNSSSEKLKRWMVVGPEYSVVIPVLDTGEGPLEYECDVVEVEAETKRDAIALAIRLFRTHRIRHERTWLQRYPDENPFVGLRVFLSESGDSQQNGGV